MAKVYILCGKIASGKTTYAEELKEKSKAIILSCDELMLKVFDHCLGPKHDETVDKISKYFYKKALELIEIDIDVIIDNGYWTRDERRKAMNFFTSRNIEIELLYIKADEAERLKRLEKRNAELKGSTERQFIISEALRIKLDAKFEEPTEEEDYKIINY